MPPESRDPEFYSLLRDIPNRKNVSMFGNTAIENLWATQMKNVNFGDFIIKPVGKNKISEGVTKVHVPDQTKVFYVPPYHNETVFMKLTDKLDQLGIKNKCERFPNHISDLLEYSGVICIPYAFSTIAFFERLQLGIITFVPSVDFMAEMAKSAKNAYGEGSFWFQPPFFAGNPGLKDVLSLSEWYNGCYAEALVYFDTWEDLVHKINTIDYVEKTKKVVKIAKLHESSSMERWAKVIDNLL